MAARGRRLKRLNEYYSQDFLLKNLPRLLGQILFWLGHPLYLFLSQFLIASLVVIYALGKVIRILLGKIPLFLNYLAAARPPIVLPQELPKPPPLPVSLLVLLITLTFGFWFLVLRDLPKPSDLLTQPRPLTTKIYDRNGKLLFKIFRNQNRTLIPLSEIPLHVRQATIAIEDAEFYYHPGFSLRGMLRAITQNLRRGELSGGSTITQQLVKNALLTPEKTIERKLKEIILAILVEIRFSKNKILEMYLNEVAYGEAAYGIEEAAQLYFGKSARDLNLSEAALLAGLPRAPTRYSPFGTNPELAKLRQKQVLQRMKEEKFITEEQSQEALSDELSFAPQRTDIRAPHFVMYVRQILVDKYGERLVEEGGLEVTTSLDLDIQEMAQGIVREEVVKLARLRVGNGAALVTNPATGEILAMVGSKDYFDVQNDGNFNVATAQRQPGSAIKPVNYSYALANGYTAASIISDTPITYKFAGSPPYSPKNYDNRFHGRLPIRVALGSSYNVPAVKVLASYGVNKMIEQGRKLGITTWDDPSRFGLSLTLGGGEVKITDMAVVYGILANYGKRVDLQPILKINDTNGRVLEEYQADNPDEEQVLDPRIAFLLTDILRDNQARAAAFGTNSLLVIPSHPEVAVKTGTTQNLRDNWAIGYTKDFVVLAWVGNNDNKPMSWVASGITGATPIWYKIIRNLLSGKPNHSWEVPDELVRVEICTLTASLSCEGCPTKTEWFLKENQPKARCELKPVIEEVEQETQGQILSAQEKQEKVLEKLEKRKRD